MNRKVLFLVAFFFGLCLFSCKESKHLSEHYHGTWILTLADEEVSKLLDMGLTLILRINDDNTFQLYSRIGEEKKLLNKGSWQLDEKEDFARFSLPDNEYGGVIKGKFIIQGNKLSYQTSHTTWIFE